MESDPALRPSAEAALLRASLASPSSQKAAAVDRAEVKREFLKIINDDILGRNARPVGLDTLDLLITLSTNALSTSNPKRTIRLNNAAIKRRLVSVEGGVNFLLKCYWARKVINLEESLSFPDSPSAKQFAALQIANEALLERVAIVQETVDKASQQQVWAKQEEAARILKTKAAIRDDRIAAQDRADREKASRDYRAAKAEKEKAAAEAELAYQKEETNLEDKKDR